MNTIDSSVAAVNIGRIIHDGNSGIEGEGDTVEVGEGEGVGVGAGTVNVCVLVQSLVSPTKTHVPNILNGSVELKSNTRWTYPSNAST